MLNHRTYRGALLQRCVAALTATCICIGCERNTRTTTAPSSEPAAKAASQPAGSADAGTAPIATSPLPKPEPVRPPGPPKRPANSWVLFRTAFDEKADAAYEARWTGGDRLEVETHNISAITLDLTKLPPGAPQKGPWNLQIDQQGIQITGARGKVLDLVRSKGGVWTVDRK